MYSIKKESKSNSIIPDNSKKGLVNIIKVLQPGKVKDIKVGVDITHGFISDLEVKLTSPSGKSVMLHNRGGGKGKDLKASFGNDTLANLIDTESAGDWKLSVKDFAPKDRGVLNSWNIQMKCSGSIMEAFVPAKSQSINSVQDCQIKGRVTGAKMSIDLAHPSIGDLQVVLASPSGKNVVLHDHTGGNQNDLSATYKNDDLADMIGQNTKGSWTLHVRDKSGQKRGTLKKWKLEFKYQEIDDLKKMEGIGPKIESLLNDANIYSWSKLSVTNPSTIREILLAAGDRFKMHDPTTWPQQAKMAANGEWEKLQKWQDELDGGRLN